MSDCQRLTHRHQLHIYYEDTDFSGYVYHANYLKFFERAREHMIGIDLIRKLFTEGIHFVVAEMKIRFYAPARHADLIEIVSDSEFYSAPLARIQQTAYLVRRDTETLGEMKKLVHAELKVLSVDQIGKPASLPDWVLRELGGP